MRTFAEKPRAASQTRPVIPPEPGRSLMSQSRDVYSIRPLHHTSRKPLQTAIEKPGTKLAGSTSPGFSHDFSHVPVHPRTHNMIFPKLIVNAPKDRYEQEADRVADEVLQQRTPVPAKAMADIQAGPLSSAAGGNQEAPGEFAMHLSRNTGRGSPLPRDVRSFIEPRMGVDLSAVHIHTNDEAVQMNQAIGARAFTHGPDIYFGAGQYNPRSVEGKHLLTHELAHVVQQAPAVTGADSTQYVQRQAAPQSPMEAERSRQERIEAERARQIETERSWQETIVERDAYNLCVAAWRRGFISEVTDAIVERTSRAMLAAVIHQVSSVRELDALIDEHMGLQIATAKPEQRERYQQLLENHQHNMENYRISGQTFPDSTGGGSHIVIIGEYGGLRSAEEFVVRHERGHVGLTSLGVPTDPDHDGVQEGILSGLLLSIDYMPRAGIRIGSGHERR